MVEACQALDVSRDQLLALIRAGHLDSVRRRSGSHSARYVTLRSVRRLLDVNAA
jgi:hypothetical protein